MYVYLLLASVCHVDMWLNRSCTLYLLPAYSTYHMCIEKSLKLDTNKYVNIHCEEIKFLKE